MTSYCLCLYSLISIFIAADLEVHTVDGNIHTGSWFEFENQPSIKLIDNKGDSQVFNSRDVYAVFMPERSGASSLKSPTGILLVDGSILRGEIQDGHEEALFFLHPDLGRMDLPLDLISKVVFNKPAIPDDFDIYTLEEEDDILFKKSGEQKGRDYIKGTLTAIKGADLTFSSSLGPLEFKVNELEAVTLANPALPPVSGGIDLQVVLSEGRGMLCGRLIKAGRETLEIATVFSESLSIPLNAIDSVVMQPKGAEYLSSLQPVEVVQMPYLGSPDLFLYPFRGDRSVTGAWLTSNGRLFARGLGLHSRTELTYDLDRKYSSLLAFVGLCDEVKTLPAEGSVIFEILLDGQAVFKSEVFRGGDPAKKIPAIDLKNASKLTVVVDFADGFDSGDRALIGLPLLVRADK